MEWVNNLRGQVVGLDTAPLIYFIEEHPVYLESMRYFFEAVDRNELTVVTSMVSLLEVLVHPLRNNDMALASEYREILINSNIILLEISTSIAEQSAQLRASYNIRTPDAIQVAATLEYGASCFLTNDFGLPTLPSLNVLVLDDVLSG